MYNFTLIIGVFMFISTCSAQQIEWTTMNEALERQKENPKKIMVFFYTKWSKDSHKMNETTLVNRDVARYITKHYYAVNFNAEGTEKVNYKGFAYTNPNYDPNRKGRNYQHFFADALKIKSYPTILFFDEEGEVISPVIGYKSARDLEIFLKMVASDDYKTVTTGQAWQNYQDTFKPKFRAN